MKMHKKSVYRFYLMVGAWLACTSMFAGTQGEGSVFIPADDAHIVYAPHESQTGKRGFYGRDR